MRLNSDFTHIILLLRNKISIELLLQFQIRGGTNMPNDREKKDNSKQKSQNPQRSNDQLGENAGEGRLMKDQQKKDKKKL
jgi:hypothetical protein